MSTHQIEIKSPDDGSVLYTLEFQHYHDSRKLYSSTERIPNLFMMRGKTTCRVENEAERKLIGWGEAWCYRKDPFDEKKGERLSLARALKVHNHALQKPARTMIWQQYFKARPLYGISLNQRDIQKMQRKGIMARASMEAENRRHAARLERRDKIKRVLAGLEKLGQRESELIGYDSTKEN